MNSACQIALVPTMVITHLRDQHSITLSPAEKKDLFHTMTDFHALTECSALVTPPPCLAPVEGLRKVQNGYCCKMCDYAVPKFTTFKRHWSREHKTEAHNLFANEGCTTGTIQHFFTVPERWFQVDESLESSVGEEPFTVFLRDIAPTLAAESENVLMEPVSAQEVPPLLKITSWHMHLADHISDRKKVKSLLHLTTLPKIAEDSSLARTQDTVQQYMEIIRDLTNGSGLGVCCLLMDCQRAEQNGKIFSAQNEPSTLKAYGTLLFHFVYAMLASLKTPEDCYKFPLTASDKAHADGLIAAVETGTGMEAVQSLHKFLLPLLSPRVSPGRHDKWQLVMECFVAVFCVRPDGLFEKPENTMQTFAKIKYLVRGTCLYEAVQIAGQFNDDAYRATEYQAGIMLRVAASLSPYNMAVDYQRIASHLAYSQSSAPATRVSDDGLTIFYRAHNLYIPTWRAGLRQILDELKAELDSLIGDADAMLNIPDKIPDDWVNETRGYSWMKNTDFGVHEHALLRALMQDESSSFGKVDRNGKLIQDIAEYRKVLDRISHITWLLAVLCYTLPGQVSRASEFVEHKILNSTRPRTVFRDGKAIWLVIRRAKHENNIRKPVFCPSKVPPELCTQLERFLIFVRPLQRVLGAAVFGPKCIHLYDEYLWVSKGKRITSEQFRDQFPKLLLKYCHAPIGVHDYRQFVVQISRTYLGSEIEMDDEMETDSYAAQRGHSVQTARRIYAPELGRLPSISSEALLRFSSASRDWWTVTGFMPGIPPKLPLLHRRQLWEENQASAPGPAAGPASTCAEGAQIPFDAVKLVEQLTATLVDQITRAEVRMEERIKSIV
ncbi:uncharacterized protein EV420DRAFT_1279273, partial [Desarmillaria tabescens]